MDEYLGGGMATIHLLVLNFNGRRLLEECLPTLLRAAAMSRHDCQVAVIDNASTDDSVDLLRRQFPSVRLFRCENRGLCSFNTILPQLESQVVVLLNNDIKLASESVDLLVAPLLPGAAEESNCFLTAPLCWLFDGCTYEGLQTALRWRWGLIQAISDYPGHQQVMRTACLTASAGAVMAVDRLKFVELGGFDGLYLPGRIEDLDFCFRGYLAGYHARYVPESVAYHAGEATFRQELGAVASHTLALRNTLLFQWKNLRHPWHKLRHLIGLPPRFVADVLRAPFVHRGRRLMFSKAFLAAIYRWRHADSMPARASHDLRRERQLLKELHWTRFALGASNNDITATAPQERYCFGASERARLVAGAELGQAAVGPAQKRCGQAMPRFSQSPGHRRATTLHFHTKIFTAPALPQPPLAKRTARCVERRRLRPELRSLARMAPSPTITVLCIVLNEERNLPGLLAQVGWADEIVVVDGGSHDATVDIARRAGARVYQRPFDNFARQQNFALSLARGDWLLSLDADERPTAEMIDEVQSCTRHGRYDAYRVRVRSSIFGRRLRFSGTQDDRQVRLVRRGKAWWQGEVHETLEVAGEIGQLRSWLDHDPLPDLATFLAKMHRYTTLAAEARLERRQRPSASDVWLTPAREVFRRLVWKQGLWDGPQGWAFCLLSGLSEWVLADKHRRLWEGHH